ncbi:hypothetical protein TNCV_3409421 [Trichonephila clavipes]|nr:hypothetical protein TNCV_3409421 [Trichonephila clavipes]
MSACKQLPCGLDTLDLNLKLWYGEKFPMLSRALLWLSKHPECKFIARSPRENEWKNIGRQLQHHPLPELNMLILIDQVHQACNFTLQTDIRIKNDNLRNPLKTPSAENAISAVKLFAFPAKMLIMEPVLPYILEEWI